MYLNDSKTPTIVGHAAVLVGSDINGWTYFAKLGTKDQGSLLAQLWRPGNNVAISYNTYADFLHGGDQSARCDRAIYIPTTNQQDRQIIQTANAIYNQDYNTAVNNYQNLVNDSLAAGGIATIAEDFNDPLINRDDIPTWTTLSPIPNIVYDTLRSYGTPFNTQDGLPTSVPDVTHPEVDSTNATGGCQQ